MATKKQKRQAAEARRQAFLEEVAAEGRAALQRDQERREIKRKQIELDELTKKRRESVTEAVGLLAGAGA